MFSCEFCEISKKIFFHRIFWWFLLRVLGSALTNTNDNSNNNINNDKDNDNDDDNNNNTNEKALLSVEPRDKSLQLD